MLGDLPWGIKKNRALFQHVEALIGGERGRIQKYLTMIQFDQTVIEITDTHMILHVMEDGGPLVRISSQNLRCFYLGYVLLRLPKLHHTLFFLT